MLPMKCNMVEKIVPTQEKKRKRVAEKITNTRWREMEFNLLVPVVTEDQPYSLSLIL